MVLWSVNKNPQPHTLENKQFSSIPYPTYQSLLDLTNRAGGVEASVISRHFLVISGLSPQHKVLIEILLNTVTAQNGCMR